MEKLFDYKLTEKKDIPSIPLYMDQVTGYLDEIFNDIKRQEDEKTLTKTMINNYVKAGLIDSPIKKKYSQDQIMELMMIYLLKNTIQIQEIDKVLKACEDKTDMYESFKNLYDLESHALKDLDDENKMDLILKLLISSSVQKKYAELLIDSL